MYQYIFNPRTGRFDAISDMQNEPGTYKNLINAYTGQIDAVSNLGTQYSYVLNPRTMLLDRILWYPPNKSELLLYLTFAVVNIAGTNYFRDLSPLGLNAKAITTTTPYDSIQLNTDIRLQNACNSAGCLNQFYNSNVYICVENGDIYMQTNETSNFVGLTQTSRAWAGMAISSNGNVYACVYNGSIYMQTNGAGNFVTLSQTTRNWNGMTASPNGNIYACVDGGDIYMQTNGTGNFVALNQGNKNWFSITASPNGNVYACDVNGDIYMQTNGTGDFVALNQTFRDWSAMACTFDGNVYVSVYGGDIYMQTNGTGDFVALNQTNRNWYGLATAPNGNVYASVYGGDMYMQTAGAGNFVALSQGTKNWSAGTCTNTAKTVLLTDLSQLYLDNYIFSNVTNNIFLIYSAEQVGNNLTIILDRIGARIEKLTNWGVIEAGVVGTTFAIKINNDHVVCVPHTKSPIIDYNIRTKTYETYGIIPTKVASYLKGDLVPNNHVISFPYNASTILDIDTQNKSISLLGDYSSYTNGIFGLNGQLILTTPENTIFSLPNSYNACVNYNYVTQTIESYGNLINATHQDKFLVPVKINDNLIVGIPYDYNKVVNIDPINKTIDEYGSFGTMNTKFFTYHKINDDLICCVPGSNTVVMNIIPSSKTVETYGILSGTTPFMNSILLTKGILAGHIIAIPRNFTQVMDIDPINKTVRFWGSFGTSTNKYSSKLIELSNGHVIAFPRSANYLIDIDPVNEIITNIYDFGNYTQKFGSTGNLFDYSIIEISNEQIIAPPTYWIQFADFNPLTNKVFRLGYIDIIDKEKFSRNPIIFDGTKRLIYPKLWIQGIIDITLR